VVERARGGANGWSVATGARRGFLFGDQSQAVAKALLGLAEMRAGIPELCRVRDLVIKELLVRRRVELTAEVAA